MEKLESTLGKVLADQRRKAGLTQEELAFQCDIHSTYVSQLERGLKNPTVRVFMSLAKAMGIEASSLLALVEEREEQAQSSKATQPSRSKSRKQN